MYDVATARAAEFRSKRDRYIPWWRLSLPVVSRILPLPYWFADGVDRYEQKEDFLVKLMFASVFGHGDFRFRAE